MKRLLVMTVGKTHSGKTTFAKELAQQLDNSLVIDQDNHAEFINSYYRSLLPKTGNNSFKYAITQTIVDYAISKTDLHLILCNSYRSRQDRTILLKKFRELGFTTVLVYFAIPDEVLVTRVLVTTRSTKVFRSALSFEEVLKRQIAESSQEDMTPPEKSEADFFFEIQDNTKTTSVIENIVTLKV